MILNEGFMNLSDDQEQFLKYVQSPHFPWYYNVSTSPNYMFHGHSLMNRASETESLPGIVNSEYYDHAISIFTDFCLAMDIEYTTILRAAINSTNFQDSMHGDIHVDHEYPHKNFLFFINEVSMGATFIYNNDKSKIEDIVLPGKHKAVVWDGRPHAQGWCQPHERRLVLIVTFI